MQERPYRGQLVVLEVAHDASDCPTKSGAGIIRLRAALLDLPKRLLDNPHVRLADDWLEAEPHRHVFFIRAYFNSLGEMDMARHVHVIKNAIGIPDLTYSKRVVTDLEGFLSFLEEELAEQFPEDAKKILDS